ncbi:uncharacterized protein LOC126416336 [Schistocerca serialis cubense]|uniref:uncharacterized protein LOC126416336 n=1 Tax=Schistocerca serialis cubense TaxID=2023355 RepID=UPI00214F385A|nr:uncharacterized protein LOC126416336 [Schistocerca serialis cubense]
MFRRSVILLICTFVAVIATTNHSAPDSITGSDSEVTIYRLRTGKPGQMFRDDHVAKLAANLEEIIMERDHEREFLKNKEKYNFVEKFTTVPYYEILQEDRCVVNNGNCSQICETVGYETVCSCREGYSLTSATACTAVSACEIVLSGTSGEFTIGSKPCQWLIKAPRRRIILITLHRTSGFHGYYIDASRRFGEIYDGNSTEGNVITRIRPDTTETVLRSSGPYVLIKSLEEWARHPHLKQRVSYVTGYPYLEITSDKATGHLSAPVPSLSMGEDCFSLTYSAPQNGSLMVKLTDKDNENLLELTPEFTFERHDGKWKREIFRVPFHQNAGRLEFKFQGEGTKVYNLGRCTNIEYHALGGQMYVDPDTVCRNGGVWSSTTQSCTCPPGFVGMYCEEGCGPNRYGENCSKPCSFLSSACEGLIFCTKELCSCAAGLQGAYCSSPCDSRNYGASCRQRCGKCKDDEPCDQYTGICYTGCYDGFYPPFCQQTYKVLGNAPDVIEDSYNSLKIRISFENVTGEGEPVFYEVQYKEEKQNVWSKLSPRVIPNGTELGITAESEILGLLPGKNYEIRAILIDKDGGSYQIDVPESKARTKCIDPVQGDYKFAVRDVDDTSVILEWSYEHDKTSLTCEILDFELSVLCGSENLKYFITEKEGHLILSAIMPDMTYNFQLTGKTVTGNRTLPTEIEVHTLAAGPERVRAAKAAPSPSGRQLRVTWLPPWNSQGQSLRYKVRYQCVYFLACEDVTCDTSSGVTEVSTTAVVFHHLHSHALYQIEITSVSVTGLTSGSRIINAVTAHTAPHVAPSAAENPILAVSNTSVSLSWMPPEDCTGLNGYIYGYHYSLVENNTDEIIQQGTVAENILNVNFTNLTPSNCYDAYITVVASGGTSDSDQLNIPFCTSSTAPERVQSLSVYKRGRRMVGLRWSPPLNTYGDIEYFTVTYSIEDSGRDRKLVTEPKRCGAWPDLYCYTVSGLSPGRKYHFEVQARNKEVNIDGEPAGVEAITLEGASTPPVNLRIINATDSSMLVEWGMPDYINGQLRSFIIIVEQIDMQINSGECCDDIPLQDYRVTSEEPFYLYEITGLSAASTYSVTVSAKTVTLGEESRVIGHTFPPKAILPQNALMVVKTESSSHNPDVVTLQMHPAERISGVNRTYILLHLINDSSTQQPFYDSELTTLLKSRLTENYHLISEYTQEEVENQSVVTFHLKEMGFVSTEIESQKYALILIQDYMGNQSMDVFITEETG